MQKSKKNEVFDSVLVQINHIPKNAIRITADVSRDLGRSITEGSIYRAIRRAEAGKCAERSGTDSRGCQLWKEPAYD